MGDRRRHRTWANAHHREWQQKQRYKRKRQYAAAKVYALAVLLFIVTFCAAFFRPSSKPPEQASSVTSSRPTTSKYDVPPSRSERGSLSVRSEAPIWASQAETYVTQSPSSRFLCNVSSITDGDTLRCSDGTKVRLHAVAARESDESCRPGHPCPSASGAAATAVLEQLAGGQTLQCEQTGTTYNRVAAICRNEQDTEINCAMVNSGTAVVWPRYNAERAICR